MTMSAITPDHSFPLRIGISSCLLGNKVRYDGDHKHCAYITQTLGEYLDFIPYCPEVAIGLGTPRPPIRLVSIDGEIRVRGIQDPNQDPTDALVEYGQRLARELTGLSGYLFKQGSPSCGMEDVKVYSYESGIPIETSAGVFASTIIQAMPELPVEEEGRLMDSRLRENFIERVFVYHRWLSYREAGLSPASLIDFHCRHKYSILAHDELIYRELGRLVADAGTANLAELANEYIRLLMQAMQKIATPQLHSNVLMHIMGYLKKSITRDDKQELLDIIDAYRQEHVPLIVPMTLIQHHLRRHPNEYISAQYYINPYPYELMLRDHI